MKLAVCWKHVMLGGAAPSNAADGGPPPVDERWSGVSAADEAALELALTMRDGAEPGTTVRVVGLGPPVADAVLRDALAAGADEVLRIDAPTTLDGATVAEALADQLTDVDLVWCGDYSLDRGTGSVPAFLAGHLGAAQALGLVGADLDDFRAGEDLRVVRRLDGGRRELLDVALPAVLSVEGSVASLRRAPLGATLRAGTAPVATVPGPRPGPDGPVGVASPYRPRARVLPPPVGGTLTRVREILHVGGGDARHAETVTLDPAAAARRLLDQLGEWGYLDETDR